MTSSNAVLTVLAAPGFRGIVAAGGGNFILSGVGGTNSGTYYVLTTTNLAMPLANWTPIATNQFDSQGQFHFHQHRANQRAATVLHPANAMP